MFHSYKREFVDGARPALRALLERDAHASAPMTLCVSSITWHESQQMEDGTYSEPKVELEVTDGWYFAQATLDEPLTRAVRRGLIKVGRKIACAGAKVERLSHGFEQQELTLNSARLGPAGWQRRIRCLAQLHSCTEWKFCISCSMAC
jgi:hypothetical protein